MILGTPILIVEEQRFYRTTFDDFARPQFSESVNNCFAKKILVL